MKATIKWIEGRWISFIGDERLESTGILDVVDESENLLSPQPGERIVWKASEKKLVGTIEGNPQGKLSKSDAA